MRRLAIAVLALSLASAAHAQEAEEAPASKPPSLIEALKAAGLDPETKVEGGKLQVMQGQRAVIRVGADATPTLAEVQPGRLADALPEGHAETYKGVGAGRLAFALDASPQKRQSIMKVWNGLPRPIAIETEIAAIRQGQLMRRLIPLCSVGAGAIEVQAWPEMIVAVTITKFAEPSADTPTCNSRDS